MRILEPAPVMSDRISTVEELCQVIEMAGGFDQDYSQNFAREHVSAADADSIEYLKAALSGQAPQLWMDALEVENSKPESAICDAEPLSEPLAEIFLQRREPSN